MSSIFSGKAALRQKLDDDEDEAEEENEEEDAAHDDYTHHHKPPPGSSIALYAGISILAAIAIILLVMAVVAELQPEHSLYGVRADFYLSFVMMCIFLATLLIVGVDCWVSLDLWRCHSKRCTKRGSKKQD